MSDRTLMGRAACLWRQKLALALFLPIFFAVGYFPLQHYAFFPAQTLQLSALDRMIAFEPGSIYAYQSLYLLMPLAPMLTTERRDLQRYVLGFSTLCIASFLMFIFFPVISPRPDGPTGVGAFDHLTAFEGKLNAFPSLHAGLLTYTLLFANALFRKELEQRETTPGEDLRSKLFLLAGSLWGGLILYATLATKQHYAIDLPAGMALAWTSHSLTRFMIRDARRMSPQNPLETTYES